VKPAASLSIRKTAMEWGLSHLWFKNRCFASLSEEVVAGHKDSQGKPLI
jgi:hypothetical protein